MAHALYRLARWSFDHRVTVLVGWLIVLSAAGVGAATLSGSTNNNFELDGIESTRAFEIMAERVPGSAPDGAQARVVFQAPEGETLRTPENQALIASTLEGMKTDNVARISPPAESGAITPDGRTAIGTVAYSQQGFALTDADRQAMEDAPQQARDAGLTVHVGGDATAQVPHTGTAELMGIAVALVVLLITFGSMVAAGLPLLTALIGVGIGVGGIVAATGFMDLSSTTPILATMLGLAVGIDYALFIVSRFRHELSAGHEAREAAGRAVGTAGSAVVVAGLTVIIALVGLIIVDIGFLSQMGLAAAFTVVFAVLIAISLLPALFGFLRKRLGPSRFAALRSRDPELKRDRVTMGRSWATFIVKRRWPVLALGVVIAALVAMPTGKLELALPDDGSAAPGTGQREAYDLIAKEFGEGLNGPLIVMVDTKGAEDPAAAVQAVDKALAGLTDDVAAIVPATPTDPAQTQQFGLQLQMAQFATATVIPKTGPATAETEDLVHDLRDVASAAAESAGVKALVTGQTAVAADISAELADAFPIYLAVIVGLAFVLLILVFRSILVPLKAVVGFLASILVAIGVTVAVFQWGWGADLLGIDKAGPLMSLLPILLTGILFGLAMDYEFFLVTRIREEHVHGLPAREAIVTGVDHGARVVTAAALIMFFVFGAFAFADDPMVKAIGFALAVGIAADAFLVRMTLVPAVMAIVGEAMWWLPGWLRKILPRLDIEGEELTKMLEKQN